MFSFYLTSSHDLDNAVWDQIVLVLERLVAGGRGVRRIVFRIAVQGTGTRAGKIKPEEVVKRRMGSLWKRVTVESYTAGELELEEKSVPS